MIFEHKRLLVLPLIEGAIITIKSELCIANITHEYPHVLNTIQDNAMQSKAVPLHATEVLGGRGGIVPTHS
jgi:hypothetical protein